MLSLINKLTDDDGYMDTLKGSGGLLIIMFLCVNELSSWILDCLNVRAIHAEPEAGKENGFDLGLITCCKFPLEEVNHASYGFVVLNL